MKGVVAVLDLSPLTTHLETVPLVTAGILAVIGVFVAYQGYRGYRRNRNQTLLFLTVGILLLTTVPFLVESCLYMTNTLTPSQNILIVQLINVLGLTLILYGFIRT